MLYTIKKDGLEATVASFGGELYSLVKDGTEYIWQAGKSWNRHAPLLFPFICSPKDKTYTAAGKEYKMKANHGFARDMEFELVKADDSSVTLMLRDNEVTKEQYPYSFEFYVKYFFENGRLVSSFEVKNTGSEKMYFYLGGHPAFNCPLSKELKFDDYYVQCEKDETIGQSTSLGMRTVLAGENKIELTRKLFDFDVIMKANPASKSISLKSDKDSKSVTLFFPQSECIAVWSPTGDNEAEFVCLEPWTSVPVYCDDDCRDIEEKRHAIGLEANRSFSYRYDIEVKA